jgi:branched-chain amino acid aminotransferase
MTDLNRSEGLSKMTAIKTQRIHFEPNSAALPTAQREAILADPGFGKHFTDHMLVMRYTVETGWQDGAISARKPFEIDPACSVLHYAQEIFEGMKAYHTPAGPALFRSDANARRFKASAERMAMPPIPESLFREAVGAFVRAEAHWIPSVAGSSLYLRPFMFASEVFLGVRPANEYLFVIIASPAGNYFPGGMNAITIWASENYIRAAPGGTGSAKCGGNYASGLVAQVEAKKHGCDQVLFLDASKRKWVEELGGMNLFFVFDDGTISTPPLDGTILPGITRDSLMTLARDNGWQVREDRYSIDQWQADAASGHLVEVFACGTAAVVTPVGRVRGSDIDFTIAGGRSGPVTTQLRAMLVGIQQANVADRHGWVELLHIADETANY